MGNVLSLSCDSMGSDTEIYIINTIGWQPVIPGRVQKI